VMLVVTGKMEAEVRRCEMLESRSSTA
jgi:hypothetical protein